MNQGFIFLHRQFLDWEWYNDNNTKSLFIHLLLKANHKDNHHRGILIKRGQLMTGLDLLNFETKISIQSIRTSLKRLVNTKEINMQVTNKHRIITICKYDSYQGQQQATNKQANKQLTSNQQATNKQLTANNNDNNDNNDNNEINNIDSFDIFWNYFHEKISHKKTKREPTLKHWQKLTIDEQRKAYKKVLDYSNSNTNHKFLSIARTYLSDKLFNDEFGTNGVKKEVHLSYDAQAYLNEEMKQKVLSGLMTNKEALNIQYPENDI